MAFVISSLPRPILFFIQFPPLVIRFHAPIDEIMRRDIRSILNTVRKVVRHARHRPSPNVPERAMQVSRPKVNFRNVTLEIQGQTSIKASLNWFKQELHRALGSQEPTGRVVPLARQALLRSRDAVFARDLERFVLYIEKGRTFRSITYDEKEKRKRGGKFPLAWAKQKFLKPQKSERSVSASVKRVHEAIHMDEMPPQWVESWKRSNARYFAKNPPDDWTAPLVAGARKAHAD